MAKKAQNGRNHQKPQGSHMEKLVLLVLLVECSYFGIFNVINQLYFVPHTTSHKAGSSRKLQLASYSQTFFGVVMQSSSLT